MFCSVSKVGLAVGAALLAGAVLAQVPDILSFQGTLLDRDGQPVTQAVPAHFRIFRGGDDTSFPSSGMLAYHEKATVEPSEGVFWHWIGTGVAQTDCPFGRCVFNESVFGPGDVPLWIEVTVDPDGVEDTGDEETILPRARVGTVGYAYRVATLEGATGGNMSGTIAADRLVGRAGAVVGDGSDADLPVITVDQGSGPNPRIVWEDAARRFKVTDANIAFDDPATTATRGMEWSVASPVATKMYAGVCSANFNGNRDNIMAWSYNRNCNGARINPSEHAFQMQLETSYDYNATAGRQDVVEVNWDYTTPGGTQWRPLAFGLEVPTGRASFAMKPDNANGGNNFYVDMRFPFMSFNRDAARDDPAGSGASFFAHSVNFPAGGGTNALQSYLKIDHTDARPYHYFATNSTADFRSTGDAASIADVAAGYFHATFSGSTEARFANKLDGIRVDVNAVATASGLRDRVNSSAAYRAHFDFSGTNIAFGETAGFRLDTPTAPGPLMSLPEHDGIRIDDQRYDQPGMDGGSTFYAAPQTVSDASEGNVVVAGTGYNHGHYQIGSTHLWEESPGVLAVKGGTPRADIDGARLVTSARRPSNGPAAWAANAVSCDTACANLGQDNCAGAVSLVAGNQPVGCGVTSGLRLCECY